MQKRAKKNRRIYDVIYFVSILTAASIFLAYFSSAYTEMTFEKRAVADHTALVLNAFGIDALKYNDVARIYGNESYRVEAASSIQIYFEQSRATPEFLEMRVKKLSRSDEQIVSLFVEDQQKQGKQVYLSKATISSLSKPSLEVDIIPECVGWMGIFAVSALIIAYPRVKLRKRLIGLVIAWPMMYAVNILRLATTFASGYYFKPEVMYFTHDILWKTILLIWALALWLFWIYFVVEEKKFSDLKKPVKTMFLKAKRVRKK
ncbi:exosortase/archaeosortase family protein [Candidatus Micrarchaeota archaeon]|nr:exosortase/archaeosortase family protein [Candidatus Micrarchaeota archaeon]